MGYTSALLGGMTRRFQVTQVMIIKVLVEYAIVFQVLVRFPCVIIITITKPLNKKTHGCFSLSVTLMLKDSFYSILIIIYNDCPLSILYGTKERINSTRVESVLYVRSNMFTLNIITGLTYNSVRTKELWLEFTGPK